MHLELMRITECEFPTVPDPEQIVSARIWHCKFESLGPLAQLTRLRTLVIGTFPDETFDVLAQLPELEYLRILHFPHVHDLEPLASLHRLVSLSLATAPSWDASGKTQLVESLEPITRLPVLQHVELFGVQPANKSLEALVACPSLRTARFSRYPAKEVERFFAATHVTDAHGPEPVFDV